MAIRRVFKERNYTVVNNTGLKDDKLSFKSKGLLAYMLSLPDDWVFYEEELVKHSTEGISSVRSGLKELEQQGYLVKQKKRNSKGQFTTNDWLLYEDPKDNPELDFLKLDNPNLENQTLLNTNNTKYLSNQEGGTKNTPNFVNSWEQNGFGVLSPLMMQKLDGWVSDFGGEESIICYAIDIAAENNAKNYAYIAAILKGWEDKGVKTLSDAKAVVNQFNNKVKPAYKKSNKVTIDDVW